MKHYSIDSKSKVITAMIARLTDKEEAEIKRYVAFGYEVIDGKPTGKVSVKRLDEAYIREYLKEDSEALDKFDEETKKPAIEKDGTIKTVKGKDGKVKQKTQGFNAGRNWFAKTYPKDIAELKLDTAQKNEIAKKFKAYQSKDNATMTKEEYTKYYYWTKIFVQK